MAEMVGLKLELEEEEERVVPPDYVEQNGLDGYQCIRWLLALALVSKQNVWWLVAVVLFVVKCVMCICG